ncbi:MAG: hypothetical protein ABI670_15875 [Chloroflexota bacterium]
MDKPVRGAILALIAVLTMLSLAACDSGGGPVIPTAAPARPTATTEAVNPHRLRPRATPTTEEIAVEDPTVEVVADQPTAEVIADEPTAEVIADEPTPDVVVEEPTAEVVADEPTPEVVVDEPTAEVVADEPTPADADVVYETYFGKQGDWSLDYPNDWQLTEDDPNTQFLEPSGEAFMQITSSAMDSTNTNEDLVKLASDQFKESFGDTYEETGQEKQNDGSYRIDFSFTLEGVKWVGQTFVEGRQSQLYMLLLATSAAEEQSDRYDAIFNHVISSYTLPDN